MNAIRDSPDAAQRVSLFLVAQQVLKSLKHHPAPLPRAGERHCPKHHSILHRDSGVHVLELEDRERESEREREREREREHFDASLSPTFFFSSIFFGHFLHPPNDRCQSTSVLKNSKK